MLILGLMLGGAVGTLSRYLLTLATQSVFSGQGFPLGTIVVNVLGCFLIGFLAQQRLGEQISPVWYLALGTGFTGAFTTFSTFQLEADTVARDAGFPLASIYTLGSLVLGYVALLLGRLVATQFAGKGV